MFQERLSKNLKLFNILLFVIILCIRQHILLLNLVDIDVSEFNGGSQMKIVQFFLFESVDRLLEIFDYLLVTGKRLNFMEEPSLQYEELRLKQLQRL